MKITRMLAFAMLVAPTLAVASASPNDDLVEEETQLQGRWRMTKVIRENETVDISNALDTTWEFKGGTFTVTVKMDGQEGSESGKYTLDVLKNPRWIDLDVVNNKGVYKNRGIYKLEGDELILCSAPDAKKGVPRPTEFTSNAYMIFVFKRVKQ